MQPRSRALKAAVLGVAALLAFSVPLEVALRLFPSAIPLGLLVEFEASLRSQIARRRQLQRLEDTVIVPRDDGGPAERLWIYKPHVQITEPFDEPGIVASVRTDDAGFCNSDPQAFARSEHIDVAAVGDSFTWCTSVEPADAWPEQLARQTGLRVYNFGMPGRGLHEYLQTLKRFALQKNPRLVVLALYEGNDLRDAVRFHHGSESADRGRGRPCPFGRTALCAAHQDLKHGILGRHSYAFNVALAAAWRVAHAGDRQRIDFRYHVRFADGAVLTFNTRNGDLDEVAHARALVRGEIGLDVLDRPLAELVDLGRAHGFEPIVVYIPSAHTAYQRVARFEDRAVAEVLREFSNRQRRYLARKAAELGLRFRDLTPALQEAAQRLPSAQPLYFRTNVHLTPAGHRIVAEEITRELQSGGR